MHFLLWLEMTKRIHFRPTVFEIDLKKINDNKNTTILPFLMEQ